MDEGSTNETLTALEDTIKQVLARRPLLAIDGAVAVNWAFEGNDYSTNYFDRGGGWLTLNLSAPVFNKKGKEQKNYLNFYVTGRYLSGRVMDGTDDRMDVFDSGGKVEIEVFRFSLSYEYLYRFNFTVKDDDSYRSSCLLKYKINDNLYLTGAFGKNFGDQANLITLLGINWGIGSGNEEVLNNLK